MQCAVLFRRINVISLTIVINKKVHITRHLSTFHITAQQIQTVRVSRQTSACEFTPVRFRNSLFMNILHICRPGTGIRTHGTKKFIRTCHLIAYGNTAERTGISCPFRLQMEPHHIVVILFIINYFRAFQNTSFRYAMCRIVGHNG